MEFSIIEVGVGLLSLVWLGSAFFVDSLPQRYRERKCAGRLWRRQFPLSSKRQIRSFLDCFCDAMSFHPKDRLKFRPSDSVFEVYRAIYGGRVPFGDDMECERFSENLAKTFSRPVEDIDALLADQVTLGELFDVVREPAAA